MPTSGTTGSPACLTRLPRLRHLDLRGNQIASLPPALAEAPQLDKLDLRWNPLRGDLPVIRRLQDGGCLVHV